MGEDGAPGKSISLGSLADVKEHGSGTWRSGHVGAVVKDWTEEVSWALVRHPCLPGLGNKI